jgi:hypothetical protein
LQETKNNPDLEGLVSRHNARTIEHNNALKVYKTCLGQPVLVLLFGIRLPIFVGSQEHQIVAHYVLGRYPRVVKYPTNQVDNTTRPKNSSEVA